MVGDACTDDTAGVVAGFGDSRIRFVNLTRNFGEQAGPNNVGMAESSAPLIAFLNHDDVWLPHHLSLGEVLLAETADLVFGTAAYVNAHSSFPLSYEGLSIGISGTGSGHSWSPAGVEESVAPPRAALSPGGVREASGAGGWGGSATPTPLKIPFPSLAGRLPHPSGPGDHGGSWSPRRADRAPTGGGAAEQEWVLEHMDDPGFACELAALGLREQRTLQRPPGPPRAS